MLIDSVTESVADSSTAPERAENRSSSAEIVPVSAAPTVPEESAPSVTDNPAESDTDRLTLEDSWSNPEIVAESDTDFSTRPKTSMLTLSVTEKIPVSDAGRFAKELIDSTALKVPPSERLICLNMVTDSVTLRFAVSEAEVVPLTETFSVAEMEPESEEFFAADSKIVWASVAEIVPESLRFKYKF